MSSKRKGGMRKRSPLTKTQLLPMSPALARERSLAHHLALASWRSGHGSPRAVNELIHAAYIAWYVQSGGYGEEPVENFKIVELAVEAPLATDDACGQVDTRSRGDFCIEGVLALHDRQLGSVPEYRFDDAERQLAAFLLGTARSSIPTPISVATEGEGRFSVTVRGGWRSTSKDVMSAQGRWESLPKTICRWNAVTFRVIRMSTSVLPMSRLHVLRNDVGGLPFLRHVSPDTTFPA